MGREREQGPAGMAGLCSVISGTSDGRTQKLELTQLEAGILWNPQVPGAWAGMTCSLGQAIGLHSNGLSVWLTFLTARWPLNSWTSLEEAQAPWTSVPRRERPRLLWRSLRSASVSTLALVIKAVTNLPGLKGVHRPPPVPTLHSTHNSPGKAC